MNREDFSHGFDVLLNSYGAPAEISLNEHEKSVFLTNAQEDLVAGLYSGRNPSGEAFENTERTRRYLSTLIKEALLDPITNSSGNILGMESNSKFFTLPDDLWFITYESVRVSDPKCENTPMMGVYPVRQDEYHKIRKNPFRGANDRRALRLDLSDNVVEIISSSTVSSYYVRYLRRLKPIILVNLPDGLTINNISEATDCELPEAMHQRILEMAVGLAIRSKTIGKTENR